MVKLKGNTLGKRQKQLNEEVYNTTSKNVDFSSVKALDEQSDVDRLYKIDVASKYKNIDYIIETLKCGDSLYISRAMRNIWLYDHCYSFIINPNYLHEEVFPFMSLQMKKKMLTTISMHVQDKNRATDFYKYCIKDKKLQNIDIKFLIWTSEQHKMEYICNKGRIDVLKLKYFIGNSFDLAEAYLSKSNNIVNENQILHELRYLFKVSNEKYLTLMENYSNLNIQLWNYKLPKLGLRFSKDIVTKYKKRIFNNIQLYINKLNINIVVKHSSIEDAKQYAIGLLPTTADIFWSMDFYKSYEKILNLLPQPEIYSFLKQIFVSKYPHEPFETSINFYYLKYYQLLTYEEREVWALKQLHENPELLGPEKDYLWYQFVNYDLAFKEIKKYIFLTTDNIKRAEMVNILLDTVRNEKQLELLIHYYYERHVNEKEDLKFSFIDKVFEENNVLTFGDSCWDVYNKLLLSTNVFSPDCYSYQYYKYKTFTILYHIIHKKTIPELLEQYFFSSSNAYTIPDLDELRVRLHEEQIELIYMYFIDTCTNKLLHFDTLTNNNKEDTREVIDFTLCVMKKFNKKKDDCPDILIKYVKLHWDHYKYHEYFATKVEENITEAKLLQLLKEDSKLMLQKLTNLSDSNSTMKINNLLKKIKIYFSNDVANDWLSYCEETLSKIGCYEYKLIHSIIITIFQIGRNDYKTAFMTKYVPEEPKIQYDKINKKILKIQESICRFAHYSRPPVPLPSILPYIKGDYVHFCIPMFNAYLVTLPMPQCLTFVSALLDSPVSIQKHGLRSAFQIYNVEDLTNLVDHVWKKTKNVSVRLTIYKALFDKIKTVDENSQSKLYEILKMLTSNLNENDDDEIFDLLKSFDVPTFKGDLLQTAWSSVQKFSEKRSINVDRKCMIMSEMKSKFEFIDKEFCRIYILDDFIHFMFIEKNICKNNNNIEKLIDAKWNLAALYISHMNIDQIHKSIELVHLILSKGYEMWNVTDGDHIYTLRKFTYSFIDKIFNCSYCKYDKATIAILEYIIIVLCDLMPMAHIYTLYLKLKLKVIIKKVVGAYEDSLQSNNIGKELATEVLTFLNYLKNNHQLYPSFCDTIASVLCSDIVLISYFTKFDNIAVLIHVSSHLIETHLPEAQMIGLMMLPKCPNDKINKDNWLQVIQKIYSSHNEELVAYYFKHSEYRNDKEM